MNYTNMDMSMLGTWHFEFWHVGIGLVIFFGGMLAMIVLYLISRHNSKTQKQSAST